MPGKSIFGRLTTRSYDECAVWLIVPHSKIGNPYFLLLD